MPKDEDKRELATNRLLEILRKSETEDVKEKEKVVETVEQERAKEEIQEEKPESEKKDIKSQLIEIGKGLIEKFDTAEQGVIGIDIGSYAIKTVYFRYEKSELVLEDYKIVYVDRSQKDTKQDIINNLLTLNIPDNYIVNTSIYGEKVLLKKVIVPKLGKKEQDSAIEWNAKKDLTFPAETAQVDFNIIEEFSDKGVEKVAAMASVSDKILIDEHLHVLDAAGIVPRNISAQPSAIFNSFKQYFKDGKIEDSIIIDIGAKISYILFVNEGTLQFARELKTGGDDINKGMGGIISTNTGIVKPSTVT